MVVRLLVSFCQPFVQLWIDSKYMLGKVFDLENFALIIVFSSSLLASTLFLHFGKSHIIVIKHKEQTRAQFIRSSKVSNMSLTLAVSIAIP